jgi:hypothetical protein
MRKIGINLRNSTDKIEASILSLKYSERDSAYATYVKKTPCNPFLTDPSDDEDDVIDTALLAHLVDEVSELDLDEVNLDTKICDLLVPGRKSKYFSMGVSSSKRKISCKPKVFK